MTETMVERVARAIWRTRENQFPARVRRPEPDTFDNASGAWDMVLDQARAAIEEMREPTMEMIDMSCAAWIKLYPGFEGDRPQPKAGEVASTIYIAAIDAALKE